MATEMSEIYVHKSCYWYPGYAYYAVEGDITGDGDVIGNGDTPDEAYWDLIWQIDHKLEIDENPGYTLVA